MIQIKHDFGKFVGILSSVFHSKRNMNFRIIPRLKTMQFQIHFPELIQDCKPDMESAINACMEVSPL